MNAPTKFPRKKYQQISFEKCYTTILLASPILGRLLRALIGKKPLRGYLIDPLFFSEKKLFCRSIVKGTLTMIASYPCQNNSGNMYFYEYNDD